MAGSRWNSGLARQGITSAVDIGLGGSLMNRIYGWIFGCLLLLGLAVTDAQAAGLPIVISATIDYGHTTLTVTGQNFGSNPLVTLDGTNFPTLSASSSQIVASFPGGSPPTHFAPGTYFLTLQYRNQLPSFFTVDIGANGPQGPQGIAGPSGPIGQQGIQGPVGAAGAIGPMGAPGPAGPAGAAGAMGATGVQGAPGSQGPQGLSGPAGAVGPQGPAGAGVGLPTCTSPDVPVLYNGAFICKSAMPRYTDNGDGTVTDNHSGLMWEKPTGACAGEVTCVNNQYTWTFPTSAAADGTALPGSAPDGSLFTDFIARLNGGDYYVPASGQIFNDLQNPACFANHCDWRIPTYAELLSIFFLTPVCSSLSGFPCIDPVLGPTQPSAYWSLSYHAISDLPPTALAVQFNNGANPFPSFKNVNLYARAVRATR
jgi:uncharacterized protein DUF1566/collagen triple helix repeat protein/IPT/TIG domain-containing protein